MPKSKEQFEKIKEERKNSILNAALYVFALNGYDAVTSDSITTKADCSHGLLYHYFKTKDDLFVAVLEKAKKIVYEDILINVDKNQGSTALLKGVLNAYLDALKSPDDKYTCAFYLLINLHYQKQVSPQIFNNYGEIQIFGGAKRLIEKGKEDGSFRNLDTNEMLATLIATLRGLCYTRLYLGSDFICPNVDILMNIVKE